MALRNKEGAAIYSPCYTNGVGTVYFDVVNPEAESDDGYMIAVEVATGCDDDPEKLPTDENVMRVDEYVSPSVTNYFANASWRRVPLLPLVSDGAGNLTALDTNSVINVNVTPGGSNARFYRIAAKIDYQGPVRFRIVRVSSVSGYGVDEGAAIMVQTDDNNNQTITEIISKPDAKIYKLLPQNQQHINVGKSRE
jgi:hypothetical protein